MNSEFFEALDLLEQEKGIPKEYMLEKVEAALISAYKRDKNGNSNVRVAIDPVIDEHDPIENAYHLEVSSPGIERVLRTEEHIEAWAGEEVEAKLFAPMDGKKSIRGILGGIENGVVTIECGEKSYAIEHKKISRMTTVFDF